ncbi:MAG TPA: 50S ribosomal protein L29 [Candidatus Paceibacterota bacterium]
MAKEFEKETIESLQKMIADKREALRVFRFEGEGSRRRNVREARTLRREIARIMTELNARNIASEAKNK